MARRLLAAAVLAVLAAAPVQARALSLGSLTTTLLQPLRPIASAADADAWLARVEAQLFGSASSSPSTTSNEALRRMDRLVDVMERRWSALDRNCDPNAVFALTYLITTERVGDFVAAGWFDDNDHISVIMVGFAQRYFDAYDAWKSGGTATAPWRNAFNAATAGRTTATEDLLLGMNAHINYDLAIVMAELGLRMQDGRSRKPDHDRINAALESVMDDIGQAIADRYDPSLAPGGPQALANPAVLELIKGWREVAWENAVLLAASPLTRSLQLAAMEQAAGTIAQAVVTPKLSTTTAERLAYCQAD